MPAAASVSDACEAAALQLITDILVIHAVVTIPFGGQPRLISPQGLDSAAHRPFYSVAGDFAYESGLEQAAALLESLVMNHPFEDGNKRAAVTSCLFFLERCGYWREVAFLSDKEAIGLEELTLTVARGGQSAILTVSEIARRLANILGPSRNRRIRSSRLLSGTFRLATSLFRLE